VERPLADFADRPLTLAEPFFDERLALLAWLAVLLVRPRLDFAVRIAVRLDPRARDVRVLAGLDLALRPSDLVRLERPAEDDSTVSRLTSLLKLLLCPPAVSS
jgi:hypothetical protein